ncbi:MAG TPA: hypothetical protein VL086_09620 [Candidatus Nitrosotalea sp.]|jgi:tellurite resistance protein TehA-like permease|nr:hypothetical protein [Candidatus Nitrosotalea sp.]
MEDTGSVFDTIFLLAGLALIVLTGLRVSRRSSEKKPLEGQRAATIGILVWLGLLGVALYMIFG